MRKVFITPALLLTLTGSLNIAYGQGGGGEKVTGGTAPKTTNPIPPKPKPTKPTPPPRKPKAPTTASLTINTSPAGSTVTVKNRNGGIIDPNGTEFILKPGNYAITVTKPGYQSAQQAITLTAGQTESLNFQLVPVPGVLMVSTDVAGSQIEISNAGSFSDRVNNLSLPPGTYNLTASKLGYRTTSREFEIKAGETTTLSLSLEAVPIEEMLVPAERALASRNYSEAIAVANQALTLKPDSAKAHLIIGYSYYNSGKYAEAIFSLSRAAELGEQVQIAIAHRHEALIDEFVCSGYLHLRKESFSFTSTNKAGHDFSIPWTKVIEVQKETRLPGRIPGRINVKVSIPAKNNKEDKKTYNFYASRAVARQVRVEGYSRPLNVISCEQCLSEIASLEIFLNGMRSGAGRVSSGSVVSTDSRPTLRRDPVVPPASSDFRAYRVPGKFEIGVPTNWNEVTTFTGGVMFAPEGGSTRIETRYDVSHGMQVGTVPAQGLALTDALDRTVSAILKNAPHLKRMAAPVPGQIKGRGSLTVPLRGLSPVTRHEEFVAIYATMLNNGEMFYLIAVSPHAETTAYSPTFGRIVGSIQFLD
jgi:hypothetical protein